MRNSTVGDTIWPSFALHAKGSSATTSTSVRIRILDILSYILLDIISSVFWYVNSEVIQANKCKLPIF